MADYMRQARLKSPQNHIVNWLKSQREHSRVVQELLEHLSAPLPDPQLERLRRIWNQHRSDPQTLLEALQILVRDNPLLQVERPTTAPLDKICKLDATWRWYNWRHAFRAAA